MALLTYYPIVGRFQYGHKDIAFLTVLKTLNHSHSSHF